MKQGHFVVIFIILYAVCFLALSVEKESYDKVVEEKRRVERGLLKALEDTARGLSKVIHDSDEKKRQVIETVFQESFYVSLGIFGDIEEQEKIRMYLPMLVLVEEDGVQFYYITEEQQNGATELEHVWSEKLYFSFPENSTEAKKKANVAAVLEQHASQIITEYNYIARQYGVQYSFFVPDFLQNVEESLEFPMLFAVFQGWPLNAAGDIVYENCIDAGGYLQEVERYVVELPITLEKTVCFFHRMDCPDVLEGEGKFLDQYCTEREAITNFGAFPCEKCMD